MPKLLVVARRDARGDRLNALSLAQQKQAAHAQRRRFFVRQASRNGWTNRSKRFSQRAPWAKSATASCFTADEATAGALRGLDRIAATCCLRHAARKNRKTLGRDAVANVLKTPLAERTHRLRDAHRLGDASPRQSTSRGNTPSPGRIGPQTSHLSISKGFLSHSGVSTGLSLRTRYPYRWNTDPWFSRAILRSSASRPPIHNLRPHQSNARHASGIATALMPTAHVTRRVDAAGCEFSTQLPACDRYPHRRTAERNCHARRNNSSRANTRQCGAAVLSARCCRATLIEVRRRGRTPGTLEAALKTLIGTTVASLGLLCAGAAAASAPSQFLTILPVEAEAAHGPTAISVRLHSPTAVALIAESSIIAAASDTMIVPPQMTRPLAIRESGLSERAMTETSDGSSGAVLTLPSPHALNLKPGLYAELLSFYLVVGDSIVEQRGYRYFEVGDGGVRTSSLEDYSNASLLFVVLEDGELATVGGWAPVDPKAPPPSEMDAVLYDDPNYPPSVVEPGSEVDEP
jgi:hypothetical protein